MLMEDGACTIQLRDGMPLGELSKVGQLYFLNTLPSPAPETSNTCTNHPVSLTVSPSFDLIHKHLAHPGKETLQLMIRKQLVDGLRDVPQAPGDFNCTACIQGKMTCGPFSD